MDNVKRATIIGVLLLVLAGCSVAPADRSSESVSESQYVQVPLTVETALGEYLNYINGTLYYMCSSTTPGSWHFYQTDSQWEVKEDCVCKLELNVSEDGGADIQAVGYSPDYIWVSIIVYDMSIGLNDAFLYQFDWNGNIIWYTELEIVNFSFSIIQVLSDSKVLISDGESCYLIDSGAATMEAIKHKDWIDSIITDTNGAVFAVIYDNIENLSICALDLTAMSVEDTTQYAVATWGTTICPGSGTTFLLVNSSSIQFVEQGGGAPTILTDLTEKGLSDDVVAIAAWYLDDNHLLLVSGDYASGHRELGILLIP